MQRNSKKIISSVMFILILVMSFLVFFSFAEDEFNLVEEGKLTVAVTQTFPPFGFMNEDGKLVGLAIELDREICRRLGLEYNPIVIKWAGLLPSLEAGKIDYISNPMDITEERQKSVTFANAWIKSGGAVIVLKDSDIYTLEDLAGKTCGALYGSTWAKYAEELNAKVKYYDSDLLGVQDVLTGKIDADITDALVGGYAIKKGGYPLRILDEYAAVVQKGHVFKKGNYELVKAVNKVIDEIRADGTYLKITSKYLPIDPFPKPDERIMTIFE